MLWVPSAKQAWNQLFAPGFPVRRLFLTVETLDLIEADTDRLWSEGKPPQGGEPVIKTAADYLLPTVWIYWTRRPQDGAPVVLDFRFER